MEPSVNIYNDKVRLKFPALTASQQSAVNKAYDADVEFLKNLPDMVEAEMPPPGLINARARRLWGKMNPKQREMSLLGQKDIILMTVGLDGSLD